MLYIFCPSDLAGLSGRMKFKIPSEAMAAYLGSVTVELIGLV